jgi:hypothetical protein
MQKSNLGPPTGNFKSVIAGLVERLGGHSTSNGAMCRCPAHTDATPSLSIRIGRKALLFKCFAGCDTADVLRFLRDIDQRVLCTSAYEANDDRQAAREAFLRDRAREIWDQARGIEGTQALRYLEARGLRAGSGSLRYHPRTPLGSRGNLTFRPALVSALHERGHLMAIQRTFLDENSASLARDLADPRRLLGRPHGGAVVLAPATMVLGLAEGVETALSAATLLGVPVWATLGSERLPHILVPESVAHLLILPDNDRAGRIGARRAHQACARQGRRIETIWPPAGFNDWNDVLRAGLSLAPRSALG